MRKGRWIQTVSGKKFYPLDPRPEDICIEDIAVGLSNTCRFAGQVRRFYSVAQHSVILAKLVSPENALWALLHDAPEAYINDVARPVKLSTKMQGYRSIERDIMCVIAEKYGLPLDCPAEVYRRDDQLLKAEAKAFGMLTEEWDVYALPDLDIEICPCGDFVALVGFTEMYEQLTREVVGL